MKTIIRIAGITALGLSLITCKTVPPQVVYVTKDSTITSTVTVYKDTVITVPGDTIKVQVPCDKDTVYIVKSKSSHSLVQVSKGKVTVETTCEQKDLIITKLRQELDHYKHNKSDSSMTKTVIVKHVPGIYKGFAWGFWVLAGLTTVLIMSNKNIWVVIANSAISLAKIFKKKS